MLNNDNQCCYFSKITSLTKQNVQSIYASQTSNTQYYISQTDKSINFLSKGGNQFFLPIDQELTQAFPLPEGLLLGWGKEEFNYAVLSNHPLGTLSTLGTYNPTLSTIDPWLHSQEEILFVSKVLPIIVTYNGQLMRHCVHLLKADQEIDCEKLENQNFLLNSDKSWCKLIAELYYEENIKEDKAKQCQIIRGNQDGELLICLLSDQTLRILEMNFCEMSNEDLKSRNTFNSLKLVQILHKVAQIQVCELFENSKAEPISLLKEKLKFHNNYQGYTAYQILGKQQLNQNLLILHTNQTFTFLNGSKIVINYSIKEQITDINQLSCAPKVNDELLSTILAALQKSLEPQQYLCILKDVLLNCLPTQGVQNNNNEMNEFEKFQYLMVFYLKLSGNTKSEGEEEINKKVKSNTQSPLKEQNTKSKPFAKLLQSQFHRQKTNYQYIPPTQTSERKFLQFAYHMTLEMFHEIQEKILYVMHLLHQELLLQYNDLANKLLYFLYCYAINMDSDIKQNYSDFYLRIDPELLYRYESDINIQLLPTIKPLTQLGQQQRTKILPANPIDLTRWFQGILTNNPSSFPILFKKTKQLCTILQSIERKQLIHIASILQQDFQDFQTIHPPKHQQFQLFYQQLLNSEQQNLNNQEKLIKRENIHSLEGPALMLYLLSQKKWTKTNLHQLPLQFRVPILEIITKLRSNFPNKLIPLITKQAFELIDRLDLYMNRKLYIIQPNLGQFKKYVNSILSGQIKSLHTQYEESPQYSFDQHTFNQVKRLFDYSRDIRVKSKMTEHIPEERLDQDAPAVLLKLLNKKLSMFVGLGLLSYGTSEHFITDQIKFPLLNLSGVLQQNSLKLTIDSTREDYTQLTQWPEFHLGVALALQLSKKLKGLSQESLRTWIFYQKPSTPSNIHGGFMLGLGMLGYLNSFNQIDLYQLLTQNHEATSVGVLLGIGASRIGTCDEPTQKSLTVHIPSLIPSIYDLELPSNVSTSALCALGFLFMASGNRNFTEVALGLIGRKPHSDKVTDREGYSLAAGVALGLINLGKGNVWSRELQIEERLIRFVQGGKVMQPPQSSLSTNFVQNENQISSIKEGNMVNVHITCPAALIALSLMFLQTNAKNIVDELHIPNSFSSLEQCNPNHIIMKAVTANLIMWDSIPNNKEQLYQQIPELIRYLFEQPLKKIHQKYYIVYNVEVIDFMSVSMIYTGMIAGGLLAIGIKHAASHDQQLKTFMIEQINFLLKLKISQNEFANDPDNKCALDQYTYYTNIVNSLQALSLLMAGSFDQEVLNIAKSIRQKMEHSSIWHFGFHQAIKMSIGMMFMGRGGFSFKKSKKSIAMLFLSFYPYYPSNPGDNKQYLQALRWSYVLSIQPKIFKIIDVQTQKQVTARVQVLEEGTLQRIVLKDPNYCELNFEFEKQKKQIQTIYVETRVLGRVNKDLLNKDSHLNNINTLIRMGDFDTIGQKLKHLLEWKYIQNFQDKVKFLQLLQSDNSNYLQMQHCLMNNKSFVHYPILRQFYASKFGDKDSILDWDSQKQYKIMEINITNEQLIQYLTNGQGDKSVYQWLVINNLPLYYELKQIKQVAKQIPKQILEFYLFRSYPEVEQANWKQMGICIQQS